MFIGLLIFNALLGLSPLVFSYLFGQLLRRSRYKPVFNDMPTNKPSKLIDIATIMVLLNYCL